MQWLFVILYGLTFFFANFGPNTTTFVIPSESFPTRARATCHGISAACGKLGAVIGSSGLKPLLKATNLQTILIVCAAVSLIGAIWTAIFTHDMSHVDLDTIDAKGLRSVQENTNIDSDRSPLLQSDALHV